MDAPTIALVLIAGAGSGWISVGLLRDLGVGEPPLRAIARALVLGSAGVALALGLVRLGASGTAGLIAGAVPAALVVLTLLLTQPLYRLWHAIPPLARLSERRLVAAGYRPDGRGGWIRRSGDGPTT